MTGLMSGCVRNPTGSVRGLGTGVVESMPISDRMPPMKSLGLAVVTVLSVVDVVSTASVVVDCAMVVAASVVDTAIVVVVEGEAVVPITKSIKPPIKSSLVVVAAAVVVDEATAVVVTVVVVVDVGVVDVEVVAGGAVVVVEDEAVTGAAVDVSNTVSMSPSMKSRNLSSSSSTPEAEQAKMRTGTTRTCISLMAPTVPMYSALI